MLNKPTSKQDLIPPFRRVGELGWAASLQRLLADFGVPSTDPCTASQLEDAETRLEVRLPQDWREILLSFGPMDFGGASWVHPKHITRLDNVWFREGLSEGERERLPESLLLAETGSDDCFAFDLQEQVVLLCAHDPPGIYENIPSVGDFLRLELIGLYSGHYGWPDEDVIEMAELLRGEWLEGWANA